MPMSTSPNYISNSKLQKKDILYEDRKRKEVSMCEDCDREFYIYWLSPASGQSPRRMEKCAVCYFSAINESKQWTL